MLVRLLSKSDKQHLIRCAELLAISDDPLLWDGKQKDEITSKTDLEQLSIKKDDLETALILELKNEGELLETNNHSLVDSITAALPLAGAGFAAEAAEVAYKIAAPAKRGRHENFNNFSSIEPMLIKKLKTFPLHKVEGPEIRIEAASGILKEILNEQEIKDISVSKLMLFELMLLALRDGSISSIEWALLKEFQHHYQLEDFIFDDLLERAETMNQEVSKIIAVILE